MLRLGYLLLLPCLFLYAYWPAFSLDYGHFDDYWLLVCNHLDPLPWINNAFWGHGRPVYGLLVKLSFLFADSVPDLKWIRLWGLANLLIFSLSLFYTLHWHSRRRLLAAGLSLLATLTPATTIYTGWAVCAPFSLAAALAVWSAHLCVAAPSIRQFWLSYRAPLAMALFLIASCIYQSAALHLPAALLAFYFVGRRERWSYRQLAHGLGFSVLVCGLYFAAYKVAAATVLAQSPGVERAAISLEPTAILAFAAQQLLPRAFELWGALLPGWGWVWIAATAALCLLGLLGICRRFGLAPYHIVPLLLACGLALGICWAPNLIVPLRVSFFRTISAPYLLSLTVATLGVAELLRYMSRKWPQARAAALPLTAAVVLLFAYQTHYHLLHGHAGVNHREYSGLKAALQDTFDAVPTQVTYIAPLDYLDDPAYPVREDEFGFMSTFLAAYQTNVLTIIAWDAFGLPPKSERQLLDISNYHWYETAAYHQPNLINGFERVHRYDPRGGADQEVPLETIEHPYLGTLEVFPDDWFESPWLGRFQMTDFPRIYHPIYGRIRFYPDAERYWATTPAYGVVWFSAETFPTFFHQGEEDWKRLELFEGPPPTPQAPWHKKREGNTSPLPRQDQNVETAP